MSEHEHTLSAKIRANLDAPETPFEYLLHCLECFEILKYSSSRQNRGGNRLLMMYLKDVREPAPSSLSPVGQEGT